MNNNLKISDKIYALFSNIFAKEPNVEFLQLLQLKENISLLRGRGVPDPEILSGAPTLVGAKSKDLLARDPSTRPSGSLRVSPSRKTPRGLSLFRSFGVDPLSDIKHLSLKDQAETLAVEYARLFLAPARETLPYESVQLGEERLWGESTVKVNEIYEKFGFKLDDSFKHAPDHLSCELSFLAQLSKLELEYNAAELIEAKTGVSKVKKHFLDNHLLRWFPGFKDKVIKNAKFSYYKELVKLLDMILNDE